MTTRTERRIRLLATIASSASEMIFWIAMGDNEKHSHRCHFASLIDNLEKYREETAKDGIRMDYAEPNASDLAAASDDAATRTALAESGALTA